MSIDSDFENDPGLILNVAGDLSLDPYKITRPLSLVGTESLTPTSDESERASLRDAALTRLAIKHSIESPLASRNKRAIRLRHALLVSARRADIQDRAQES